MSCDFPIAKAVEAEGDSAPMVVGVVEECVSSTVSNPDACSGFLNKNGWPAGLQDAVTATIRRMPIRYVICDDSGSMSSSDGSKLSMAANGNHR
jgi:hypothetical protein